MKSIVIYYSMTGNTKRIAEAIHSGMSQLSEKCDITPLNEVDTRELLNYDLIGLGSPVIDYVEAAAVKDFVNNMPSLKGRYGFTFCTHGTRPGNYIARMVRALRKKGLTVTGWNDWYGSCFIPYVPKPYYSDGHPDDIDLKEAEDFGRDMVERSRRISTGETRLIPRLPGKVKYVKLYSTPLFLRDVFPDVKIDEKDWLRLKPRLNTEKCKYPDCTICMDNCPAHSIKPSESATLSIQSCEFCGLWFCEQLCPTGAIEVDWTTIDNMAVEMRDLFIYLAEPLKEFRDIRRFRSLIPPGKEGSEKPLYKIKKHPRLIIRDGVARVRP